MCSQMKQPRTHAMRTRSERRRHAVVSHVRTNATFIDASVLIEAFWRAGVVSLLTLVAQEYAHAEILTAAHERRARWRPQRSQIDHAASSAEQRP